MSVQTELANSAGQDTPFLYGHGAAYMPCDDSVVL